MQLSKNAVAEARSAPQFSSRQEAQRPAPETSLPGVACQCQYQPQRSATPPIGPATMPARAIAADVGAVAKNLSDAGLPGAAASRATPGGSGSSPSRPSSAWSPGAARSGVPLHAATSAGVGGAYDGHLMSGHHHHNDRNGAGNGKAVIPKNTRRSKKNNGVGHHLFSQLNPWGGTIHPLVQLKGALTVTIKTGSCEGAGTDARLWMRVHGKEGSMSPVFELSRLNRHSFADGQLFKFDMLAPYPEVSLLDVNKVEKDSDITPLCGDIKAVEIWRDDGRDVALDGEDPSWFLSRVTFEEPHTGEHWDFVWHDWVEMTMSERALKAIDSPDDIVDHDTSMNRIAACRPGAYMDRVIRYDTMRLEKAGGIVNVSNTETELQWWAAATGERHFVLVTTLDRIISAAIIFTICLDVFREEFIADCIFNGLSYAEVLAAGEEPSTRDCSSVSAAQSAYPFLLALDLFLLLLFLVELVFRFTLKYWGLRNVFASVLKSYNRRYRKLGLDAFKKNGIRRNDTKRSKHPWFMTLYAKGNEQFRKEFDDTMSSDLHAKRRIPFNFLAVESMYVFDAVCFVYTCRRLIDLSLTAGT